MHYSETSNELAFVRLNSECVPLTPVLAQTFHDMEASPTEREFNPRRANHLQEKIRAGLAVTFHWASANLSDKTLRMNGNHSSAALLALNGEFPEHLMAHVDRYQVENAWGLALLFRQFDDKKSSRSAKDICGAYQGLFPELKSVPKPTAKLAVEGISWYRQNIQNPEGLRTPLFSIKTPELQRNHIVAAIYASYCIDRSDAHKFWMETARGGQEYEAEAPSTVLDADLKRFAEEKKTRPTTMKPANWYSGSCYAWNAFRRGKQIDKINWDVSKNIQTPI
jgi:hypothetical protein